MARYALETVANCFSKLLGRPVPSKFPTREAYRSRAGNDPDEAQQQRTIVGNRPLCETGRWGFEGNRFGCHLSEQRDKGQQDARLWSSRLTLGLRSQKCVFVLPVVK